MNYSAITLLSGALVLLSASVGAQTNQLEEKTYAVRDMDEAARTLPCLRLSRNEDGSWMSLAEIVTPPDNHWRKTRFNGAAAEILDQRCGTKLGDPENN
jgi:hypothetical protein